ncbi:MAG: ABC transporter substrate-binding protein [Acidobacteria bacterium]|nr:MAG: ABC transporter substrate-binding protein [Acidobacteriota bacterium]
MKRRDFLAGLGTAAALPALARAQQAMPTIGFLSSRSPSESEDVVAAFREGLAATGYNVGRNVAMEYRWAEGQYDRLPTLANDLVRIGVTAILAAGGPPSALAAKKATMTIPIVFSAADDPVGLGLVSSLSHPGGNITGMSVFNAALSAKRLALLHEFVPTARTIAYLTNPTNPSMRLEINAVREAAVANAIEVKVFNATNDQEIEAAFADISAQHIGAVMVAGEPFFDSKRAFIVGLAARHAIPASYSWRQNVALGGLLSYGTSITDSYRDAGVYCGRILRGERPADLPVMQPTKFALTINLKTAKSLGLAVPPALLTGADEVIE